MEQTPAFPVSSQSDFLTCQLSVSPARSGAAANLTLLNALPRRQLGWAKNSHRSALSRIYIQVKVIQHSGCPVAFVKFMFSGLPSAAEPRKACQHSTAVCLQWDFTGDASSSESSLERRLSCCLSPWSLTALLTRGIGYFIQKVEDHSSEGVAWPVAPESMGDLWGLTTVSYLPAAPTALLPWLPFRLSVLLRFRYVRSGRLSAPYVIWPPAKHYFKQYFCIRSAIRRDQRAFYLSQALLAFFCMCICFQRDWWCCCFHTEGRSEERYFLWESRGMGFLVFFFSSFLLK